MRLLDTYNFLSIHIFSRRSSQPGLQTSCRLSVLALHAVDTEEEWMVPLTDMCNPVKCVQSFHYGPAISQV